MPKIPPRILNCVFFLYHSVDDAKAGKNSGGTGFFVGCPSYTEGKFFVYAITNWHVAIRGGASVVRVNKAGGGIDVFDLDPADWHFKPAWHDLAIAEVHVRLPQHDFSFIDPSMIATPEFIAQTGIGPGEDIFMAGRFVDHDGADTNVPAVRFGNISVMPQAIPQGTGAKNLPRA